MTKTTTTQTTTATSKLEQALALIDAARIQVAGQDIEREDVEAALASIRGRLAGLLEDL